MTAPTLWYTNGPKAALDAVLALGTPRVILLSDTYVIDQDAHAFVSDIIADEAAGTGYTAGGNALTGVATAADSATNEATFDADDISGISVSCCYAAIAVDTGTDATSPVLTITDLSGGTATDLTVTGIVWDAGGIGVLTSAA